MNVHSLLELVLKNCPSEALKPLAIRISADIVSPTEDKAEQRSTSSLLVEHHLHLSRTQNAGLWVADCLVAEACSKPSKIRAHLIGFQCDVDSAIIGAINTRKSADTYNPLRLGGILGTLRIATLADVSFTDETEKTFVTTICSLLWSKGFPALLQIGNSHVDGAISNAIAGYVKPLVKNTKRKDGVEQILQWLAEHPEVISSSLGAQQLAKEFTLKTFNRFSLEQQAEILMTALGESV